MVEHAESCGGEGEGGRGGGSRARTYIKPTATSSTLSRRAKFVKLSHAVLARRRNSSKLESW